MRGTSIGGAIAHIFSNFLKYYVMEKTMSVRTHGRCVNMVLLHGTCSISMKTLVNVTLENKLKKNSLLNLVLLLFLSYDDVAFK